jgi:hypothetical protein
MANTGFKITPTVRQYFTTGPNSSSVVDTSFDTDLTVSPFSASLGTETYHYRSYDPDTCEPGFEDCVVPILTSVITGSAKGRFNLNYVTQSSFNDPLDITASVANNPDFTNAQIFSSSIGSIVPITSSFVSGTIYFKAFTSCSGPDRSPDADPLTYTFVPIPPPLPPGVTTIIFSNTLSSPMEVVIRSTRGNVDYRVAAKSSVSYDYTNPNGKSADLNITIKGGSRSAYGNAVQRRTSGRERVTYTTGANFDSPLSNVDSSTGYNPSNGISFTVRQLEFPNLGENTSTTFTLIENPPPPPSDPGPPVPYTPYPQTVFGSTPYATEDEVCANSGVNSKENTYFKLRGYLYNTIQDAQSDIKAVFPYTKNYILTSITSYLIVNSKGYIESVGQACVLPQITIVTFRGKSDTQEEACARKKLGGSEITTYEYKDNRLVRRVSGRFASTSLSGRYPIFNGTVERGGQNVILSSGKIIGYETCGTELTDVTYGKVGWPNSSYPLGDPENGNPRNIQFACSNNDLITYSLGPSGVVYYGLNYKEGKYKYVPVGLGLRWYKTTDGTFVNFDRGLVVDTANPC